MKLSELAKELGYKTPELRVLVERRQIPIPEKEILNAQLVALVRARIAPSSRLTGEDLQAVRTVQAQLTSEKQAKVEEKQKREEAKRTREAEKARKEAEKAARKAARELKSSEKLAKKGKAKGEETAKTPAPAKAAPEVPGKKKVKQVEIEASVKLRPVDAVSPADVDVEEPVARKPVIEIADKPEVRVMRPFDIDRYSRESDRPKAKAPTARFAKGPKKAKEEKEAPGPAARGRGGKAEPPTLRSRRHTGAGRQLMKPSAPAAARPKPVDLTKKKLSVQVPISVRDFSAMAGIKVRDVLRKLHDDGLMATVDTPLEEEQVVLLGLELNRDIEIVKTETTESKLLKDREEAKKSKDPRAPVVVFMGHVDHGKTTLMDKIRKANVAGKEFGGITQHIGAYRVKTPEGKQITFLDTPGHEAFTKMRARGANVTDIAVIVVAADEGVMPQTEEAISHAKEAGVAMMVAITKVDKKDVNLNRVKQQLSKIGLIPEEYGGETITVPVSGLTGEGVPKLLEMILLQAEVMELRAEASGPATGSILEARKTEGKGPVATLLVQNGTLRRGDTIIVGSVAGRIRAMFDEHGRQTESAGPSMPVEIMGLEDVPEAGAGFITVKDVNQAKEILRARELQRKEAPVGPRKHVTLESLFKRIEGGVKEVKLILKADVKGSLEALEGALAKLSKPEVVGLKVIHAAVGSVAESDVLLADASDAIVVGFNVTVDGRAQDLAKEKGIQIKSYPIIYELLDDVKAAMEGLLEPDRVEEVTGRCEVKQVFKISKTGTIAGCSVREGKVERTSQVRVIRAGRTLHTGKIESLKRFKDDVREVTQGYECGIKVGGFDTLQQGDILEVFVVKEVSRKLFQRQV
jgi:translation initiation factor IF-2